ncbi:MAG: glycoside hydrolase family 99-like domain-containing protein, partial [Ginsengibacter sp.]
MIDNDIKLEALPWTGERYLPEIHGNIELEHLHRYLFASRLSLGKRILDIASGEGYGSALLAQSAMSVVGVDISAEAVSHAKAMYQADNLEFKIGSCHAIPLPDHSVDMVVSFETIEHHDEHEAMMREIKRVMTLGGLLVISSPDKLEYSDRPGYANPYHIRELYRDQFKSLLSKHFKHHHIAGQRVVYGSAIFGEDGCGGIRSFDINDKLLLATPGIARALYLVAVASDAELPFPESGILEQLVSQSDEVGEGIRKINVLSQTLADREEQIVNLKDQIACIGSVTEDKERQLNQILQSRSWRITAPLRKGVLNIRSAVRSPHKSFLEKIARYLRVRSDVFPESAVTPTLAIGHDDALHNDVFNAAIDAEVETIRNSGLFDETFYRSMYPDLQPPPRDLIRHYCEYGWREGRNPSVDFDTCFYLATYSDICNAGINPFLHYVAAGASEMRRAAPDLVTRYENDIHFGVVKTDIKLIAFYSSPDWVELRGGRPDSRGQRQALLPHEELGLYDPLDKYTLMYQAQMAKRHGLYGFCFQLSISMDGAVISRPIDLFLAHDDIDFRFCVQAKLLSENIVESVIVDIVRAVSDRRYIHLKGRPIIIVTVPGEKQQAAATLNYLRHQLTQQGIDDPFLIGRFASAGEDRLCVRLTDLAEFWDAVLDLPSNPVPGETGAFLPVNKNGIDTVPYSIVVSQGVARTRMAQDFAQPLFPCVMLGRDNTASKAECPIVYTHFHLTQYRRWLDAAIAGAKATLLEDRRFVFVNGWNNWNEGLFLEPDRQGGF